MCLIYVGENGHTRAHTLKSGTVVSEMLLGDTSDTSIAFEAHSFAMFSGERLRKCIIMFDFYVNPAVCVSKLTDKFRLQSVVFGFHL